MKSSRTILSCLISIMLAASASAGWEPLTDKIPLSSLPGSSLPVGDKEFSEFHVDIVTVSGGAFLPDPNTMTVQGVRDVATGDYGLRFNGFSWSAGSNQIITVDLSFKVSIQPGYDDYFIKDVWLYLTGAGAGGTGVVTAGENVWDHFPGGTEIASLYSWCDANNANLSDYAAFAPLKEIYIQTKHISVTGGTNGSAHFSEFFQFYSQVPEPATLVLLGTASIWIFTRKKQQFLGGYRSK
jgi:hypothetical protein